MYNSNTLYGFYSRFKDATLIASDADNFKGDAIRLTAGGLGEWADTDSYADDFIIGTKSKSSTKFKFVKL
ncbi:hypothetical protein [Flavobacterium undicola]|uniref:hypothetical protein n=1 Tax=Flavobacterium undicola TaxID=1932779 RepID=UPI001377EC32|nr:hypothetical protein [Flavobacterium undicola]MBA0884912.1 hypothetical protein [Flavobacterium undicola]